MNSSKPKGPTDPQPPGTAPGAGKAAAGAPSPGASAYSRFIPREELGKFSAWNPDVLEADQEPAPEAASKPAPPKPAPEMAPRKPGVSKPTSNKDIESAKVELERRITIARQAGYQDGYRDGLAALDNFKATFTAQLTQQLTAQIGEVSEQYFSRLDALEQQLAGRMAGVALDLARQIVRGELSQRPELIVGVTEEALAALLTSARHVCVRLHPDDQALVGHAIKETLHARAAKLVPDPAITRGGCVIESDIAVVDASVEARWRRVSALLGSRDEWLDKPEYVEPPPLTTHEAVQAEPDDQEVKGKAAEGDPA